MDLKTTLYSVADQIATITLNRPHRGNAWTGRMHTEYRYLLDQADKDPDVRVIILTGSGERFCVGGDSQALDGHSKKGSYDAGTPIDIVTPGTDEFSPFRQDFAYQFAMSKPVIAAINGAAAGVGLVMACYADIRFAVPGAKLTTAHGPLNLPAEYGLSWLLPRLIGGSRAMELLLSSRKFLTDEAHQIGLVHRLVPPQDLLAEVRAYASDLIARVSPEALRQSKRQTYLDFHRDVGASVEEANALLSAMVKQPDYSEAIRAFLEKRPAAWGISATTAKDSSD
ncbi:MAG: enoyl-CoA hydratase-related protein [Hyphomonadaceae bacterium]|nr:enoyl-CoA hydratase-related protein [Hyphomonadaceae bacterium]